MLTSFWQNYWTKLSISFKKVRFYFRKTWTRLLVWQKSQKTKLIKQSKFEANDKLESPGPDFNQFNYGGDEWKRCVQCTHCRNIVQKKTYANDDRRRRWRWLKPQQTGSYYYWSIKWKGWPNLVEFDIKGLLLFSFCFVSLHEGSALFMRFVMSTPRCDWWELGHQNGH